MKFSNTLLVLLLMAFTGFSMERNLTISKERGKYQLDFGTTYRTYVRTDIETVISLPEGYTFINALPGERSFVRAKPIFNKMYIKKVSNESFETNLTLHVITPEKFQKILLFKVVGTRGKTPRVYAIEFEKGKHSELNQILRKKKAEYEEQALIKLSEQERELNEEVHSTTLKYGKAWFIKTLRGKTTFKNKGAEITFDGMINSRGETFYYFRSPIELNACDIVSLQNVGTDKKNLYEASFFESYKAEDGSTVYVFVSPEIAVKKKKGKYRYQKLHMKMKVWSLEISKKIKIS